MPWTAGTVAADDRYVATMLQARGTERLPQVDNLKSLMVAWIIAGHALLGYTAIGGWPYDEINEVTLGRRTELVLAAVLGPSALFVVGTFFFLAGIFTQPAMARKGPARFARDRLIRLGVPFLAYAMLAWPVMMWLAYRAAGYHVSYWWILARRQPVLDSGQLWFAEVLLYVSLGYALWAAGRPDRPEPRSAPLGGRRLIAVGAAVALASFVVRLEFPARSIQPLDLHLWQWPQLVAMFLLGVAVARRGWLTRTPERVHRACRRWVVATVAGLPVLAVGVRLSDLAYDAAPFVGGWHWQALVLAGIEAGLVVAGSVWMLGVAQRRLTAEGPVIRAAGRAAFPAFVLQGPVLLGLAVALRPVPATAVVKGLVVGVLGILLSFALGWLVVQRTPRPAALDTATP